MQRQLRGAAECAETASGGAAKARSEALLRAEAAEAKKRHTTLKGLTGGQTARRDADVSRIEEAIVRIDGLRPLVHASAFLQSNKQIEGSASGDGTLQDTIDTYARPASLAPFPPGFMSTSCKPILFDLVRTPRSCPRLLRF